MNLNGGLTHEGQIYYTVFNTSYPPGGKLFFRKLPGIWRRTLLGGAEEYKEPGGSRRHV